MGCWDIYCFICGNSCHTLAEDLYNEFIDAEDREDKGLIYKIKDLYEKTKWFNSCTLLLENNQVMHGAGEYKCSIDFIKMENITSIYFNIPTLLIKNLNVYFCMMIAINILKQNMV